MVVDRTGLFEQVHRARASLGEALGKTQDIRQEGFDVDPVDATLAGAVKALFMAETTGLQDAGPVFDSMEHLRATLVRMQDVRGDDPGLRAATETVARTLAILFPVHRALEAERSDGAEPIPLTVASRKEEGTSPLPLLTKREPSAAKEQSASERRDKERRDFEVEIGIQSETNFFTGFSMDISSGGLFVATYDVPPVGTSVNVNFSVPGGPMMSLNGEVMWVREFNEISPETAPGMGVRFDALTPEEEEAINLYISSSTPLFYE